MKPSKTNKTMITAASAALMLLSLATQAKAGTAAQILPEGSYLGRLPNRDKVVMMVRQVAGRGDSMVAALMRTNERLQLYMIDRRDDAGPFSYGMTPLVTTPDGEIGVTNDDPSLVLRIVKNGFTKDPIFTISSANSSNKTGFQGSMIFKGRHSHYHWIDPLAGIYKIRGVSRNAATISIPSNDGIDASLQAQLSLRGSEKLSGDFVIREKVPGFYTLKAISVRNVGTNVAPNPSYIGMFLKHCTIGCRNHFLLVNPVDMTDVLSLKHRK